MLRHFINTIDYAKLIEMQAKQCEIRVSQEKSKGFNSSSQSQMSKRKSYINNSVKRHH